MKGKKNDGRVGGKEKEMKINEMNMRENAL